MPTQVAEITRSLTEREAAARAAEGVAAAHLQREQSLIRHEADLLEREQAVAAAQAAAAEARNRLDAEEASQKQQAARLGEAAAALEERQAGISAELAGREATLAGREEELAAAVLQFERERDTQSEADAAQRQQMVGELRRLETAVDAALAQLRQAEAEGAAQRAALAAVQREVAEAEMARDSALRAHTAAQQVGQWEARAVQGGTPVSIVIPFDAHACTR